MWGRDRQIDKVIRESAELAQAQGRGNLHVFDAVLFADRRLLVEQVVAGLDNDPGGHPSVRRVVLADDQLQVLEGVVLVLLGQMLLLQHLLLPNLAHRGEPFRGAVGPL